MKNMYVELPGAKDRYNLLEATAERKCKKYSQGNPKTGSGRTLNLVLSANVMSLLLEAQAEMSDVLIAILLIFALIANKRGKETVQTFVETRDAQ